MLSREDYSRSPETIVVRLARTGDREAFSELVGRRQVWIRDLMRRCSGDVALADDLSQQVFLQAWRALPRLQQPARFGPWLKRIAINTWLQHVRKKEPTRDAVDDEEITLAQTDSAGVAMDLDHALSALSNDARLCVVLSYHEGMTHEEIAGHTGMPAGTVKSHIRRGTERLRKILAAYVGQETGE